MEKNIRQIISNNIKNARKLLKITQDQIAKEWGIKREQYSRYERGINQLDYERIYQLCNRLDITPNELFSWEE